MSLNDRMTALGNSVRNLSGTTDKLSVSDMANLIGQFSAFKNHGILANDTDLNKVTDSGSYNVSEATNKPVEKWGSLIVIAAGNRTNQIFIADNGALYIRSGNGNDFDRPWIEFSWNVVGGVAKALLCVLLPVRGCAA